MSRKLNHPGWIPRRTQALVCSLHDCGDEVAAVQVAGELRGATGPAMTRALRDAERHARLVLLDLRQLTFIDPCGVQAIVAAGMRARRAGARLVVVREPLPVEPAFTLSAAEHVVEVVDLAPGQPAVQALLELAQRDQAA